MNWNDLSMTDRATYIKLGIKNGITNLNTIRGFYNKYAEGGPIKPLRATPTLRRKFYETDEEYQERINNYDTLDTASVISENQRISEENKRNRQQYLQSEEGKRKYSEIQRENESVLGIMQNAGDFLKFGYDSFIKDK